MVWYERRQTAFIYPTPTVELCTRLTGARSFIAWLHLHQLDVIWRHMAPCRPLWLYPSITDRHVLVPFELDYCTMHAQSANSCKQYIDDQPCRLSNFQTECWLLTPAHVIDAIDKYYKIGMDAGPPTGHVDVYHKYQRKHGVHAKCASVCCFQAYIYTICHTIMFDITEIACTTISAFYPFYVIIYSIWSWYI